MLLKFTPQLAGKLEDLPFFNIPWGHNREIMDSLSEASQKLWYANQTIKNVWSRNVLMHQIKSDLYQRQTSIENIKLQKIKKFQFRISRIKK